MASSTVFMAWSTPGDDGNLGGNGDLLGGDLVAHGVHAVHGGADEGDTVLFTLFHQNWVFRQEAIPGVDGVHIVVLGNFQNGGDVQIGVDGALLRVQGIGLVRQGAEHGVLVFLGVDGYRGDAQLVERRNTRMAISPRFATSTRLKFLIRTSLISKLLLNVVLG